MAVAVHIIPLNKLVAPFSQQLVRCQGAPRGGAAAGKLAQKPCNESTAIWSR